MAIYIFFTNHPVLLNSLSSPRILQFVNIFIDWLLWLFFLTTGKKYIQGLDKKNLCPKIE